MKIMEKLQLFTIVCLLSSVLEMGAAKFPEIPSSLNDYRISRFYGVPQEIRTIYRFTYNEKIATSKGRFDTNAVVMIDLVERNLGNKTVLFTRTNHPSTHPEVKTPMAGDFVDEPQEYDFVVQPHKKTREFMVLTDKSTSQKAGKETAVFGIPDVCLGVLVLYEDERPNHCDFRVVGQTELTSLPEHCTVGYIQHCTDGARLPHEKATP